MALRALFATNVRVVEFACVTGTRVCKYKIFVSRDDDLLSSCNNII